MSEHKPPREAPREPEPLDYRDPRDEIEQGTILHLFGACVVVVIAVYGAIMFGGVNWDKRGAIGCGILAVFAIAAFAMWRQKRFGATAPVAGMWLGIAVSLLLIGVCASMR